MTVSYRLELSAAAALGPRRAPASARLQAADRIVERILGKVGEKLLVQKAERREVTVRYDVERLAEIAAELKRMGAIDGDVAKVRRAGA